MRYNVDTVKRGKQNSGQPTEAERNDNMKSVYVGKKYSETGFEMCLVIDSRIDTGAALVYNIAKNTIEVLPFGMWHRQAKVYQEICEDNRNTWEAKLEKAAKKNAAFIEEFQTA